MNWQKTVLASVAMFVIGGVIAIFTLKGLVTSVEAKEIIGGFGLLLIPSPLQHAVSSFFAGRDLTVQEPKDPPAPPPPPAVPAEAPTKPVLPPSSMFSSLVFASLLAFCAARIMFALVACSPSQPAADAEHGFEHTVGLSVCEQRARQAATDAASASDASPAGDYHVRRVAALAAFDKCAAEMKEGGI